MCSITSNQNCQRRGKICFFIRKGVNFKESEDLSKWNSNTETCSIDTENENSKNLFQIISGVYKAT